MVVKRDWEFASGLSASKYVQPSAPEPISEETPKKTDGFQWSSKSEARPSYYKNVSLPTKNYIDNVISDALKHIKNGENVAENLRLVNLFSNIAGENPLAKELKSYIA